jgi:hypothetical protein
LPAVRRVHEFIGFIVVALFAVGWLWGLVIWIAKRQAGDWFWRWLAAVQVVAVIQALIGVVLLVLGYRPETWLHYVYGFGPLVLLAIAHAFAREEPFRAQPWVPFTWAAFFCFGLALRALTTGLGYA